MKRTFVFGGMTAVLVAAAAGCGANNELGVQQPLAQDGGGGDACVGPLAAALCPDTWDVAQKQIACWSYGDQVTLADDGTYFERAEFLGSEAVDQIFCVYDRARGELVGARRQTLADDFCDGTSAEIYSGVATQALFESYMHNLTPPMCPTSGHCRVDSPPVPCPASWELAQSAPDCAPELGAFVGRAGGYFARGSTDRFQDHRYACYYDEVTHALVGASATNVASTTTAEYCNGTSFDELWGAIQESLPIVRLGGVPLCPDGGAAD
jgi:hypothetical protein